MLMELLTGRATTPGMSYYRQGDAAGSAQLEGLIEAGEDWPARRVRNLGPGTSGTTTVTATRYEPAVLALPAQRHRVETPVPPSIGMGY